MSTATLVDWDGWRAAYDDMGFADQRAFYDDVYRRHPGQARASVKSLRALVEHIGTSWLRVIELGGWDGGLAAEALREFPSLAWRNFEISSEAVANSVCADMHYRPVALDDWYWESEHVCDLFVASHVIEHLKWRDVVATFDATDCRWMYLQAPLRDGPTNWRGYHGSHILEVGWAAIEEELGRRGFRLLDELTVPNVRCFERVSA